MSDTATPEKKKMGTGAKVAFGCLGLVVVIIVIFVAIAGAGIAGVAKVAEEVSESMEESEKADEEAFDNAYALNDEVVVNDVRWIITESKNLGSTLKSTYGEYGDDCVANSGSFVKVTIKVKNNSSEMVSIMNLNIYDSQKREFISSPDVFSCVEEELFLLDNINPGIEKTFVAVYEIPEDATGLKLKIGDLDLFDDGQEYVSLGL